MTAHAQAVACIPEAPPLTILDPAARMSPQETALQLGVSKRTLDAWRSTGRHALPYYRLGGRIYYSRTDVLAWLEARQRTGTRASLEGE